MEAVPEYTELEKQRLKERWEALSAEEKHKVHTIFMQSNAPKPEPPKFASITYKQLAQNWKDKPAKEVEARVKDLVKNMNSKKEQLRVVNKPGSVHTDENGDSYMVMKSGKSMFIGKAKK